MKDKRILKNILSTLFTQIVTILCGFIIPSALIKTYGSSVNGLVNSITQFLAYITLLDSGIAPVVKSVLYKPIAENKQREIENILKAAEKFFKTIAYIFILYIAILCIVFPIMMAEQFNMIFTLSLVIIISISTFAEYYFGAVYSIYLQTQQKKYVVSNIQTITAVMNAILVILLIKIGANIQIVKLASATIYVLRPLLQRLYVKKKYNIDLKNTEDNYKLKQKWDGLAQHVAGVVHENTDVIVLTIFCDIKEVSVYSVYMLVIKSINKIVTALTGGMDDFFGNLLAKNKKEKLNKFLLTYELIFFTIITIIFSCTLQLIVPFVNVYTKGITDISYYRPAFAYIMVIAELIGLIKLPYTNLVTAAGHFKETRIGAWITAFTNIVISVILVNKLGIIGVAIGTVCAMCIRTIEMIYHASKKILDRSVLKSFIRIIIIVIELFIIAIIFKNQNIMIINTYALWILYAIKVFFVSSFVIILSNFAIYKKDVKDAYKIIKDLFNKKGK